MRWRYSAVTLEEILQIPGNRAVFAELQTLLRAKRAVAFVGAGASGGLYPMWNQFIEDLADHAVTLGMAEPAEAAEWKADTASTPQQRVDRIKAQIGKPHYAAFIRKTFAPKKGADGRKYTPTHASAMRLPFRGFVTTNYDVALSFARSEIRPGSLSMSAPTWVEQDQVARWRDGEIFYEEDCPILGLHGIWDRGDTIVLDTAEYSKAYAPGLYQETFRELWVREKLVFLGFGFADPQFTAMADDFLRAIKGANMVPRHIALLGFPAEKLAGVRAVKMVRDEYGEKYHVKPLFYPTDAASGHAALGVLLQALEQQGSDFADRAVAAPLVPGPCLRDGREFTIPDLRLTLLPIPAGTFAMGSDGPHANADEKPITTVTLTRPFWLGRTPVTQAQWVAVMGSNPSEVKGESLPVENISWDEAVAFCQKLTERERKAGRLRVDHEYRLPTEAEWEYACRGGTTGDFHDGSACTQPSGKDPTMEKLGWYRGNSGGRPHSVGQKLANVWGLRDLHGNVYEWCADQYGVYLGGNVTNPAGSSSRARRVSRGGGWASLAGVCRSASRDGREPGCRLPILGFRLAAGQVK